MIDRNTLMNSINCPFELRVNEYTDIVQQSSLDWISEYTLLSRDADMHKIRQANMTAFVAYVYPEATLPRLQFTSDFLHWAFILDDYGDESALGKNPVGLRQVLKRYHALLIGASTASPDSSPMEHAIVNLAQRIPQLSRPTALQTLLSGCEVYFEGMVWEAQNRELGVMPDLNTYIDMRPKAGALPPFLALVDIAHDLTLSQNFLMHILVQELATAASNITCWINDLLSLDKEISTGDVHNLILVIQREQGISLDEAQSRALVLCNDEMDKYLELEQRCRTELAAKYEYLDSYIAGLRTLMRGTLDWTFESMRYWD